MKAGEGVSEYFSRVLSVANKMRTHGEQMQDVTVVEKILKSLSEKFNYVVCSIEESKDIDQLSIDELQSSLIVHEPKFQRHTGEEQALKITSEDTFGARGRGRGRDWDDEEDNETVNAENDGAVSGEEEEVTKELVGSPQTGENGKESSSSDEGRARRPPGLDERLSGGRDDKAPHIGCVSEVSESVRSLPSS
ncbi:hypothetical protein F0562_012665 [Nyssa sinensis]|uniref:Retrovirus-related Pol polyprotein from transposon TNT 1-94 n=1 Tax=Nyssa sinensis TaxID=561372 RepID=A0A5J4ZY93_9ASTE|nr:hypothetical protein F0562_012665 [Nyssa sinensis]